MPHRTSSKPIREIIYELKIQVGLILGKVADFEELGAPL